MCLARLDLLRDACAHGKDHAARTYLTAERTALKAHRTLLINFMKQGKLSPVLQARWIAFADHGLAIVQAKLAHRTLQCD